eukprot:ctg_380.g244
MASVAVSESQLSPHPHTAARRERRMQPTAHRWEAYVNYTQRWTCRCR